MLSCIKFTDYLHKSDRPEVLLSSRGQSLPHPSSSPRRITRIPPHSLRRILTISTRTTDGESNSIASFNESFIQAFRQTPAFELWNQSTDDVIFDLVEPRYVPPFLPPSFSFTVR